MDNALSTIGSFLTVIFILAAVGIVHGRRIGYKIKEVDEGSGGRLPGDW